MLLSGMVRVTTFICGLTADNLKLNKTYTVYRTRIILLPPDNYITILILKSENKGN